MATVKQKIVEAFKNGVGTYTARLVILSIPFLFSAGWWGAKVIVEQARDAVIQEIRFMNARLDNTVRVVERHTGEITGLQVEAAVTRQVDLEQNRRLDGMGKLQ